MKNLCLIMSLIFLVGCSTTGKKDEPRGQSIWREDNPETVVDEANQEIQIDTEGLQSFLGLTRGSRQLGFKESMFNTCQVGFGYPKTEDCKRQYFVVIHFQLLCRYSEGTISTALGASDLSPLSGRPISWNLKNVEGVSYTDANGFGQIRVVSSVPQKTQRLRLSSGDQFLYVRAGEINRIVTPEPWCSAGVVSAD